MVILIVDDDPAVRRAVGRLLRSCGHEVQTFGSSEAYLVEPRDADCVVLDIHLPGLSGLELEELMRRQDARIAVVFITAHDDAATRTAVERTRRQLLNKPFEENSLLAAIEKATGRSR